MTVERNHTDRATIKGNNGDTMIIFQINQHLLHPLRSLPPRDRQALSLTRIKIHSERKRGKRTIHKFRHGRNRRNQPIRTPRVQGNHDVVHVGDGKHVKNITKARKQHAALHGDLGDKAEIIDFDIKFAGDLREKRNKQNISQGTPRPRANVVMSHDLLLPPSWGDALGHKPVSAVPIVHNAD
jgi:hypothetical protein